MVALNRLKISNYYDVPSGWNLLPHSFLAIHGMDKDTSVTFLNGEKGMQLFASIKDFTSNKGTVKAIHLTITPVCSVRPDLTEAQLLEKIEAEGEEIIVAFFNTKPQKLLDDPNLKRGRHWIIPLRGM